MVLVSMIHQIRQAFLLYSFRYGIFLADRFIHSNMIGLTVAVSTIATGPIDAPMLNINSNSNGNDSGSIIDSGSENGIDDDDCHPEDDDSNNNDDGNGSNGNDYKNSNSDNYSIKQQASKL